MVGRGVVRQRNEIISIISCISRYNSVTLSMKKHNVSDPSTEGQTSVGIQGTTKKGKPVVRKRQLSADDSIGNIEIPKMR